MPRTETQLLERVYQRSAQIKRRRRTSVVAVTVASVLVAVVVPYALRRDVRDAGKVVDPATEGAVATPTAKPSPAGRSAPVDGTRGTQGAAQAEASEAPATPAGHPSAVCDPVVVDAVGDTNDTNLDIRSSSIAHDVKLGVLMFRHRMRDLTGVYSSGQSRQWDLLFSFDGKRYTIRAEHGQGGFGDTETFRIFRDTTAAGTIEERTVTITTLSGTIDNDADEIRMEMALDDFNRGEAAVSRREGRKATPMRAGSVLSNIEMRTDTSKLATNDGDAASGSCDVALGP